MAEINDFNVSDAANTARWPEGMALSSVNDAGRADEGILGRWYQDVRGIATVSGSGGAYTLTTNRSIVALYDGLEVIFRPNHANPGVGATLAINGLAATDIKVEGDQDPAIGALAVGRIFWLQYDGTNFQAIGFGAGDAVTAGNNTFSGNNTFTGTTVFRSTDAGAGAAPIVDADRESASPADDDFIGVWGLTGRNDAVTPETIRYASLAGQILDFTDGEEDGRGILRALIAGTDTDIITFGPGVQIGAPTGGDQGAGTLNLTSVHKNGNEYSRPWTTPAAINVNSGSSVTLLSSLDGENVQEIEINLLDVSPSAQAILQFQIGPTAGLETANYSGKGGSTSSSTTTVTNGAAFNVTSNNVNFDGADLYVGNITIRRFASDTWSIEAFGSASSGAVLFGMGRKTIAGDLDQLAILLSTGNFDGSGTALVRWR